MAVVAADTRKPMYLRGLREPRIGFTLGQDMVPPDVSYPTDIVDPSTVFVPPPDIGPINTNPSFLDLSTIAPPANPLLDAGLSPSDAALVQAAVDNGMLTNEDFQNIISGALSPQVIQNAISASGASSTVAPDGSPNLNDLSVASSMIKSATALAAAASSPATLPATVPTTKPATPYQPPAYSQGQSVLLPAGSSPRVGVPSVSLPSSFSGALKSVESALTSQSIPGVPNWVLFGGIAAVFLLSSNLGRGQVTSYRGRKYRVIS